MLGIDYVMLFLCCRAVTLSVLLVCYSFLLPVSQVINFCYRTAGFKQGSVPIHFDTKKLIFSSVRPLEWCLILFDFAILYFFLLKQWVANTSFFLHFLPTSFLTESCFNVEIQKNKINVM